MKTARTSCREKIPNSIIWCFLLWFRLCTWSPWFPIGLCKIYRRLIRYVWRNCLRNCSKKWQLFPTVRSHQNYLLNAHGRVHTLTLNLQLDNTIIYMIRYYGTRFNSSACPQINFAIFLFKQKKIVSNHFTYSLSHTPNTPHPYLSTTHSTTPRTSTHIHTPPPHPTPLENTNATRTKQGRKEGQCKEDHRKEDHCKEG